MGRVQHKALPSTSSPREIRLKAGEGRKYDSRWARGERFIARAQLMNQIAFT